MFDWVLNTPLISKLEDLAKIYRKCMFPFHIVLMLINLLIHFSYVVMHNFMTTVSVTKTSYFL